MKKYALIIIASGLLCMLQVQSAEKSKFLRIFKNEVLKDIEDLTPLYHPGFGFNSDHAIAIAFNAKRLAVEQQIPLNEVASILIALLTQEASADLEKWGVINPRIRQEVFNEIKRIVNQYFAA